MRLAVKGDVEIGLGFLRLHQPKEERPVTYTSSLLGEYLRARRAVCQPADIGLWSDARRRVPGLRRDEVATRASISPEYYLRLEQGKGGAPSDQVLDGLATALNLDDTARAYMERLARAGGRQRAVRSVDIADYSSILGVWDHLPAYLSDRNRDLIYSNEHHVRFTRGAQPAGSNLVEMLFSPPSRALNLDWEDFARRTLAAFRFDADPTDSRFAEVLTRLRTDADFVRLWARHDVEVPGRYTVRMESVESGRFELTVQHLRVPDLPGYQLTIYIRAAPILQESSIRQASRDDSTAVSHRSTVPALA